MAITTNFKDGNIDIGSIYVSKADVISGAVTLSSNQLVTSLWTWGDNSPNGQLGDNTTTSKSSPVQTIAAGIDWKSVASGNDYMVAIKRDRSLWVWGLNTNGQLGTNNTTIRSSPVQTIAGGSVWVQASAGQAHTASVKTDGTLWLWGLNGSGQLGDNTSTSKSSPVQTVTGGSNWAQVSCGGEFTAAVKTDSTLWLWGLNDFGALGDNSVTKKSSPVQTVAGGSNWRRVACGTNYTAAIKTDGTLWLWGRNASGQLGDNTSTDKSSPVQTVTGGSNWSQVACGANHTAAIKTDGTLWMWGNNGNGQLGTNNTTWQSSPVQTVAGGSNWAYVACGAFYTAAIKTDGTLWLWGGNDSGQLGDNTTVDKSSPVQTVISDKRWVSVSCSGNTAATTIATNGIRETSGAFG